MIPILMRSIFSKGYRPPAAAASLGVAEPGSHRQLSTTASLTPDRPGNRLRPGLLAWLILVAPLPAQETGAPRSLPKGHEENRRVVALAHAGNVRKYAEDRTILVLPGLVADRKKGRVEVMVERTALGPNAPCEFTVIGETSDHGYEALLISFARPSAVQQALEFIGAEPGAAYDPESLRFWARGGSCVLSLSATNGPPLRLERLLVDRRTGKPLREEGFLFTGARLVPALADPQKLVPAADEYQPKSIVSLFNATCSILTVPYSAPKEEVYQNTIVNPDTGFPEGALLTLAIEPASQAEAGRAKDLLLLAGPGRPTAAQEPLASLDLQLSDGPAQLNGKPGVVSMLEALAGLDRTRYRYYLTVRFGDQLELGQAQALARILAVIDCERGVRVEPPPAGQLYYRAFMPDARFLDRRARIFHPWELALSEKDGQVSGRLIVVDSVWKNGVPAPELSATERAVASPRELRRELDAEQERARRSASRARPPVLLVFAPGSLKYGQLAAFLEPVLPTLKIVHVCLDAPVPPLPRQP
jgi:hypothetical protein